MKSNACPARAGARLRSARYRAPAFAGAALSDGRRGAAHEGENLFTGTRGACRYDEMAALRAAERRFYRAGVTPDFSTTGKWRDVAHYTQMIWRGTTELGRAMAGNATADYLVCRYAPPGNVVGQPALLIGPVAATILPRGADQRIIRRAGRPRCSPAPGRPRSTPPDRRSNPPRNRRSAGGCPTSRCRRTARPRTRRWSACSS